MYCFGLSCDTLMICYVPVGWNCVFYVCDDEIVVFYSAFFDQVVGYSGDVVAMVDVCQFVYFV